jgi:hypothetical protein
MLEFLFVLVLLACPSLLSLLLSLLPLLPSWLSFSLFCPLSFSVLFGVVWLAGRA